MCSSAGMGCEDGDWGVHGEQSMRVALTAAGQSADAVCTGGFRSGSWDGGWPYVYEPNGNCRYFNLEGSGSTRCSAAYSSYDEEYILYEALSIYRRLCRCV